MTTNESKLLALISALLISGAVLTGCNTVEGVGQDVEELGEEIEDEARDARD